MNRDPLPERLGTYFSPSSFWIPDWIPEVSAWLEHAPFAFWLVEALRPGRLVELGCHWGYSYLAFCQSVQKHGIGAACHAVDTWRGDEQAGFYGEEVFAQVGDYNHRHYAAFSSLIRSTFDEALAYFPDGSIDLLHIDGLHTYEAVRHDFESWRPKLSARAVVLFHDINVRERDFGAWKLWEELAARHPHFAFHHGHGLGVLGVGDQLPPALESLLALPQDAALAGEVRSAYARLGGVITGMKIAVENQQLHQNLQESTGQMQRQAAEFASKARASEAEVAKLETDLAALQGQKTGLARQLEAQEAETKRLVAESQRLVSETTRLQAEKDQIEKQLASLIAEMQRLTATNFTLQGKKQFLEEQLAAQEVRDRELIAQNAVLEVQKNHVRQQLGVLADSLRQATEETDRLQTRKSTLEEQLAVSSTETARLATEEVQLQLKIVQLEQILDEQVHEKALQSEQAAQQLQMTEQKLKSATRSVKALSEQNQWQKRVIKSAQAWQKRSWLKRAFHRWRAPDDRAQKLALLSAPEDRAVQNKDQENLTDLLLTIFDKNYYLRQNPDVAGAGLAPLEHYQSTGWRENRHPHPYFDVAWYLRQNPDVAQAGVEPLQHYLKYGWRENRHPHPYFDVVWYLKHYPDVRQAEVEPLYHYLEWGWKEGHRLPTAFGDGDWYIEYIKNGGASDNSEAKKIFTPEIRLKLERLDPTRPTVLLVTHDATRTGAPTILWNLAREFKNRCNLITLALGGGPLVEHFASESQVVIALPVKSYPSIKKLSFCLQLLLEQCKIQFAIVNSIESSNVLHPLARQNIPVVHLIHEFAEYSRPIWRLRESIFHASATVFPSEIVRQNALAICGEMRSRETFVLPQGFCEFPATEKNLAGQAQEKQLIQDAMRPVGWEDAVVVLGIGTIQMRKGTDLFFLCAEKIIKDNPGKKIRFVWAGAGYDPEKDVHFSVYLADQLRRMSASSAVCLLPEISQPQIAYELADLFLLSSRLDPFPLVAQEAMRNALPVLCFASATGTAEVLQSDPATAECVLPYLDTGEAVRQIQRLLDDPVHRRELGAACQRLAAQTFDFPTYARRIEDLALCAEKARRQEVADAEIIRQSGLLDLDYLVSPAQPAIWSEPAWWYARSWASQIGLRKPFPGFHPGIYAELQATAGRDPLAHYCEAGQPAGAWNFRVIRPGAKSDPPGVLREKKIALHLHLFYPELAGEMLASLQKNQARPDLFITVPDEAAAELARRQFEVCAADRLEVVVAPNRGRDLGAFLCGFGSVVWLDYDLVGHLHTKKSLHLKNPRFVKLWSDFLLENLLGGRHAMMDALLAALVADETLGLVYPDDPHVIPWDQTLGEGQALCQRLGLPAITRRHLNFPVGTCFWARPAALRLLLDQPWSWDDFPPEPLADDGTLLHALERLLPHLVETAGYGSAVTQVPGVTR